MAGAEEFAPNSQLGHYRIVERIGVGGMGVVYKASDTKLGRAVALKIIRADFQHHEGLLRFEREARVLASLNHPRIAGIYGIEEAGGTRFLALEYVPGPTLHDRLLGGPLGLREAMLAGKQIAEALEAAHAKGIIHRDLKPANIKVTEDGQVKVLDFGLAKSIEGPRVASSADDAPTMPPELTRELTVLGTAAYMSPEQARGQALDSRTDIWSFGCVLFQALSGKPAFSGPTVTDVLAAVIEHDPDWQRLPSSTPPSIRVLLQRCLQKDPQRRLRDIGDARLELEEALTAPRGPARAAPAAHPSRVVPFALGGVLVGAAIAGGVAWNLSRKTPAPGAGFTIRLGPNEFLPRLGGMAFSPDGTSLAYLVARGGQQQLYLRRTTDSEATAIPHTEGIAGAPVFSPDGRWLAFWQDAKWKKVMLSGGPPAPMFDAPPGGAMMASWGPDGSLVFGVAPSSLARVPAAGGTLQYLSVIDPQKMERWGGEPQFLPDGKTVLFGLRTSEVDAFNDYRIAAYSLDTMQRKILVDGGMKATYLPSRHLVYVRAGTLLAVPFDLAKLAVTGPAVPVLNDVYENAVDGTAQFAVSASGSLAYAPGGQVAGARKVVWVDRDGKEESLALPPRSYLHPRISPDGQQLVLEVEGPNHDVFVYELARGILTKVTFDGSSHAPLWSPDGKHITFRMGMPDPFTMWWMPADRSGPAAQLATTSALPAGFSPFPASMSESFMMSIMTPMGAGGMSSAVQQSADSWSRSGRTLAFTQTSPDTGSDIYVYEAGERKSRPFVRTKFDEGAPRFSPDGRWISYASNESGQSEIYVQEYPGPGPKFQVSADGGTDAAWKNSGGELYYRNGDKMMVVSVATKPTFTATAPRVLWEGRYNHGQNSMCGPPGPSASNYDVTADGKRFLMVKEGERDAPPTEIRVVVNWSAEVKRIMEAKTN